MNRFLAHQAPPTLYWRKPIVLLALDRISIETLFSLFYILPGLLLAKADGLSTRGGWVGVYTLAVASCTRLLYCPYIVRIKRRKTGAAGG